MPEGQKKGCLLNLCRYLKWVHMHFCPKKQATEHALLLHREGPEGLVYMLSVGFARYFSALNNEDNSMDYTPPLFSGQS